MLRLLPKKVVIDQDQSELEKEKVQPSEKARVGKRKVVQTPAADSETSVPETDSEQSDSEEKEEELAAAQTEDNCGSGDEKEKTAASTRKVAHFFKKITI